MKGFELSKALRANGYLVPISVCSTALSTSENADRERLAQLEKTVALLVESNVALTKMIARRDPETDVVSFLFGLPLDEILRLIEESKK